MPRTLYHFEIEHDESEGPQGQSLNEKRRIANEWRRVEEKISELIESQESIHKVYQDGLHERSGPNGMDGFKKTIQLAQLCPNRATPNDRVLARLVEKGAELMITENYELWAEALAIYQENNTPEKMRQNIAAQDRIIELLDQRDLVIAEKIKNSLHDGEIGILLLGAAHDQISPHLEQTDIHYNLFPSKSDPASWD